MTSSKKIHKNCRECSKPFFTYKAQIDKGGGSYCCRKCFTDYFKKNFKPTLGKTWKHTEEYKKKLSISRLGKNNPMYRHGEYSGKKRRGLTQPQKEWRKSVFVRDKYTCQSCKKVGGDLQAHHIVPWADSVKLRFDIDNGGTLCVRCHKILHEAIRCAIGTGVKSDVHYYIQNYNRLKEIYERH